MRFIVSQRVLIVHMLLARLASPKGKGHMLSTKCACGRSGHVAGQSAVRTVHGGDEDDPRVHQNS
jgi:hypothetical protein